MKKATLILTLLTTFLFSKTANAQYYDKTAVGVNWRYELGPTYRYATGDYTAIEGQFGFRNYGFVFTGLWELNAPIIEGSNICLLMGGGAHIGAVGNDPNPRFNNTTLAGIDGIFGFEFPVVPKWNLALSLYLGPRLEFGHGPLC